MLDDCTKKSEKRVLGIRVHSCAHKEVLSEMDKNIQGKRNSEYISITNTEAMYRARRDVSLREYYDNASFSLCDGMGVVIAGGLEGHWISRFNGPDLVQEACAYGVDRGWRHFVYGGKEGVAPLMMDNLTRTFPGMVTAGTICSVFRELTLEEEDDVIQSINSARPDILWVCLGLPLQEMWIARYIDRIDVPWLVGVGGAVDYFAGATRRAPKWIRIVGLEWLYRLYFEPRMFKRVVMSFKFLLEAIINRVVPNFLRRNSNTP